MAFPLTTCGHTIQDDEQRGLILYGSELGHTYPEGQVRKGPGGTSRSQRSRVPTLRALITQTLSVPVSIMVWVWPLPAEAGPACWHLQTYAEA